MFQARPQMKQRSHSERIQWAVHNEINTTNNSCTYNIKKETESDFAYRFQWAVHNQINTTNNSCTYNIKKETESDFAYRFCLSVLNQSKWKTITCLNSLFWEHTFYICFHTIVVFFFKIWFYVEGLILLAQIYK